MQEDVVYRCQYWETKEPLTCIHWDATNTVCTYKFENSKNVDAEYAPYCNLIGTLVSCKQYESPSPGAVQQCCILPDPRRHVCNRNTGYKWVVSSGILNTTPSGSYQIKEWSFNAINGYNNGNCDNNGTDTTCSGYSPYHLGFGVLNPSSDEDKYDTFINSRFSTTSEFGFELPTNFVVYNIRAKLSKCYWWSTSAIDFIVNSTTGKIELSSPWACSCPEDTSKYSEATLENGPPCNGCKPECPYYTGICWKYCRDEKMNTGDPILAEQVHELRYYHREDSWTEEAIKDIFIDEGTIFTWEGVNVTNNVPNTFNLHGNLSVVLDSAGNVSEYEIPSVVTTMKDFTTFNVETSLVNLTQGTTVTSNLLDYPTLIRELQILPLSPIIKNKYTTLSGSTGVVQNYFETPYLKEAAKILIYGKVFYDRPTKALNLSDKDIKNILPYELYYFDDIYSIENALSSQQFKDFSKTLEDILNAIEYLYPEKVAVNEVSSNELVFTNKVNLLNKGTTYDGTNKNIIMVWQKVDDYITYSKTTFTKLVVGGILSQSEFKLEGDSLAVDGPKDYETDFNAYINKNGSITFNFIPFITDNISSRSLYLYNDSLVSTPVPDEILQGFNNYKLTATTFILKDENITLIGSNGYILLDLSHPYINNVFKPFEVGKIKLLYTLPNNNQSSGSLVSITKTCEMSIIHHGADGLIGQQQLIVKPKNMVDFNSMCDVTVVLEGLTFWDKRSWGDAPPVIDFFNVEEDNNEAIVSLDKGSVTSSFNKYIINDFGWVMTPSVVIANSEGKPFTQYKTKPIGKVNQPCCPDVEIFYDWTADYITYQNKPICRCCGPWSQVNPVKSRYSYTPECGDHFQTMYQMSGPMWWPYNACSEWTTYHQLTNLNNFSLDVVGLYQQKTIDPITGEETWLHGSHDMRMQGPDNFYGIVDIGCNSLLPCSCNMRTYNAIKKGDNVFDGYAKIRAGVDAIQIATWKMTGSELPKFGNATRSFLRSYRTLDSVPYLSANGTKTMWKMMPASMMFSTADITSNDDQMWNWYCTNEGPTTVNPLGFLLAKSFDGLDINEVIDDSNRFRHEEVFRCKSTIDIAYQTTIGKYNQKNGLHTIVPWYEFKKYPVGNSDSFIQWAWQEIWLPLERNYKKDVINIQEFIKEYVNNKDIATIKGPFINDCGIASGIFFCLDVLHPKYLYNYKNKEYRQVITEGENNIIFIAPIKDLNTGEYIGYPKFSLGNGPKRGINWAGEWLTKNNQDGQTTKDEDEMDEEYNFELYDKCIGDKYKVIVSSTNTTVESLWSTDVDLFGKGYTDTSMAAAELDDRMCDTYNDDPFDLVRTKVYFQRGVTAKLNSTLLSKLPLKVIPVYQLKSIPPNIYTITAVCGINTDSTIGYTFENVHRTIGRVSISFYFGTKILTSAGIGTSTVFSYYHIPQVIIYSSDNGITPTTELYRSVGMELYTGANNTNEIVCKTFEWENTWDYIGKGSTAIIIKFRTTPTQIELSSLSDVLLQRYETNVNMVEGNSIEIFEEILTDGIEKINIHERKYYVSYGASGITPPQGKDDDESIKVLNKRSDNDMSCVWQQDDSNGVIGVPNSHDKFKFMNKVRGRIVFECYEDNHLLEDKFDLLEGTQKSLYDLAVNEVDYTAYMVGVVPPPLKDLLDRSGITFGGSNSLTMFNNTVTHLAELNKFPKMSSNGHRYQPASPKKEYCMVSPLRCIDGGRGGDAFKYEYKNMDYLLGDNILTNAVLYVKNEVTGNYEIGFEGNIQGVISSTVFQIDTETQYGTTGSWRFGNAFDTIVTNPITQLYSGAAWQIERIMMYDALMDTAFPFLFDREPSPNIYNEKTTQLYFGGIDINSYNDVEVSSCVNSLSTSWSDLF